MFGPQRARHRLRRGRDVFYVDHGHLPAARQRQPPRRIEQLGAQTVLDGCAVEATVERAHGPDGLPGQDLQVVERALLDSGPQPADPRHHGRGPLRHVERIGQPPPRHRAETRRGRVLRRDQQVVPAFQHQREVRRGRDGIARRYQQAQQADRRTHRTAAHALLDGLLGGQRDALVGRCLDRHQHRDPDPVVALAGQELLQHNRTRMAVAHQGGRGRRTTHIACGDPSERVHQPDGRVVGQHRENLLGVLGWGEQHGQR
ncbi:hypothetical protein, partial [Mycolicibacterium mageritense]|uniref:hypothetical protein n=1 Tax=Mycolicibacterium mageritense TaxID=53462 RepID=UPI001E52F8FD